MQRNDYYFIRPYDQNQARPPQESFNQILSEAYLHPFNWRGRTTRKSYWISYLIGSVLAFLAFGLMSYCLGNDNLDLGLKWIDGVVSVVVFSWLFLAGLGQQIRRLHDVGYSGYWLWAIFTGIGSYFILYLSFQPSLQRPVKWGTYLYLDKNIQNPNTYYAQKYDPALDHSNTPVPPITQILKEHFFACFNWKGRSTRTSYWIGVAVSQAIELGGALFLYFELTFAYILPNLHLDKDAVYFSITDLLPNMPSALIFGTTIVIIALMIWAYLAQLGHAVRRLHDGGFSGWWWWICLFPDIGNLLLSFLLFHPAVKRKVIWGDYLFKENDHLQ